VTAIDAAWQAVERGDPTALRQCVVAMSVARDVLAKLRACNEDGEVTALRSTQRTS